MERQQATTALPVTSGECTKMPGETTVLVVDDDAFVLDLLDEFLQDEGYKVITASSGEAAVSQMNTTRADVALVDYKMPGIDGLQTIEKINEIDPDTVTVLVTGFPTLESSIQAIKLGASDYILKPFKLNEISIAMKKAVRERAFRLEMKELRKRVHELEKSMVEKKDGIKVNQKLGVVSTPQGYSANVFGSPKIPNSGS